MQTPIPNSTRRSVSSRRSSGERERHRTEVSSGGLVFKIDRGAIFFAMVKDSYGKWAFPKGHVRAGESYKDAAIREIREEMGLTGLTPLARLSTIDIWFKDRFVHKGKMVHKYIHYFLFVAPYGSRLRKPEPSGKGETIRAVAWVPAEKLLQRSSYKDMIGIIKHALRLCTSYSLKTSARSDEKATS